MLLEGVANCSSILRLMPLHVAIEHGDVFTAKVLCNSQPNSPALHRHGLRIHNGCYEKISPT